VRPFTNEDGSLCKFDLVTANPMWNQKFPQDVYENDPFNRFQLGYPPSSSADWGWIQHMYSSLKDNGKMAVVLDTGAVSRGSGTAGSNRERDIRKEFVENDEVEAVILLPENLFYNTTAPGIILVINKDKKKKNEVLLINGSKLFEKGRPKNHLSDEKIAKIAEIYLTWKEDEGTSKIVQKDEVVKNDYNVSPSRYVLQGEEEDILPLEDAVVLLREAEEERKDVDEILKSVLNSLGMEL
jgi:type I restriction enzyme M protein